MRERHGVLLFPGFAEGMDCVSAVADRLDARGVLTHVAVLRGNGAPSPEALHGVSWHDWMTDAESALRSLLENAEKAIIIGHSMGGLAALNLAADHPAAVDSIVLAAAAVQLADPLAPGHPLSFMAPVLGHIPARVSLPAPYARAKSADDDLVYSWAPSDAMATLMEFSRITCRRLPYVTAPALIMQSLADTVVAPQSAEIIFRNIATPGRDKRIVWFKHTDHIMFCDCERDAVIAATVDFVNERVSIGPEEACLREELVNALWSSK